MICPSKAFFVRDALGPGLRERLRHKTRLDLQRPQDINHALMQRKMRPRPWKSADEVRFSVAHCVRFEHVLRSFRQVNKWEVWRKKVKKALLQNKPPRRDVAARDFLTKGVCVCTSVAYFPIVCAQGVVQNLDCKLLRGLGPAITSKSDVGRWAFRGVGHNDLAWSKSTLETPQKQIRKPSCGTAPRPSCRTMEVRRKCRSHCCQGRRRNRSREETNIVRTPEGQRSVAQGW